jgi:hypothetical protein
VYIDLNMVLAGVVSHPKDWSLTWPGWVLPSNGRGLERRNISYDDVVKRNSLAQFGKALDRCELENLKSGVRIGLKLLHC